MGRSIVDKSVMFLLAILVLALLAFFVMISALRVDPIEKAINEGRIIKTAIIFERNGKPAATQLMMYSSKTKRAVLLDIPSETGLIIKSINRMDSIDVLYKPSAPQAYLEEIERLCATSLDYYLVLNERSLSTFVDLLDGISVFLPNPINETADGKAVSLPSGFVVLDGSKVLSWAGYKDPYMPESEVVAKRQILLQSILKRLSEKSDYILGKKVYPKVKPLFKTNLKEKSLFLLLKEYSGLNSDRIVLQRLSGNPRNVEGKQLLFPHYDGDLVKDIVKQSLNALISPEISAGAIADKVFTLEILNGTSVRGLAQRTAEIYQGFGYEIISVANASSSDIQRTSIVNHYGDEAAAKTVASVINCREVVNESSQTSPADFVIILGRDFNGRNCVY